MSCTETTFSTLPLTSEWTDISCCCPDLTVWLQTISLASTRKHKTYFRHPGTVFLQTGSQKDGHGAVGSDAYTTKAALCFNRKGLT